MSNRRLPIDAETRGRRRQYLAHLRFAYDRTDLVVTADKEFNKAALSFGRPACKSRTRDFLAMRRLLPDVYLEVDQRVGRSPLAIWTVLRPQHSTIANSNDPGEQQPGVTVDFVAVDQFIDPDL